MIVGHEKQLRFLKQIANLGKFSHAYLFSGQEKLGKKTIALEWISSLFNEKISKKAHPDVVLVTPEKKTIQISQIRNLIWKLQLTPFVAPIKVAIIDEAHLMGIEAQHSLLKTLEEPKEKTILILVTEKPEMLFPTIRSRCEIIKFYPVKKSEIKNYLKKKNISEKEAEEIASIARGRPGEAIDFILNPQKLESRKKIIKEFIKISNSPLGFRFRYAKDLSQTDHLREILDIWESFLRDVLLKRIKKSSAFGQYSVSKLKNFLELLQRINFLILTTNLNQRLALEVLLMEL